jgi:HK97 family phage prohead protease/HK97 family phage major capsid protein
MQHKSVALSIKSVDDDAGTFTGLASVFDNVDYHGDIVRRGAFTKSLAAGSPIPLLWMHKSDDPRNWVGDVVSAVETDEGLQIVGKFDLSSEHGRASHRNVKGRRISGLSIGYAIRSAVKTAEGNELRDIELVEVSIVARGANPAALVTSVKSAGHDVTEQLRTAVARARVTARAKGNTMHDKSNTEEQYLKGRDEQLALAKTIVDTATALQRDLTEGEVASVEKHLAAADEIEKKHAAHEKSRKILAELDAMAASNSTKSQDGTSTAAADSRRLTFKGMAANVATKMLGDNGQKALAPSGAAVVSQEFSADPIPLGRIATGLLDVLPVKVHTTPEFAYMRQSTRTNNAAVVAEGAVKPTSVISVVRIEAALAVVAHLSEGIPRYWLLDSESLQQFIDNELRYGLGVAVEAKVVADINGTSGIQTQAYSTSVLQTLRKSITKLEANGYPVGSIILHPLDFEGLELALASTNAVEHMSLPYSAADRRLFGVPVVTTVSAAAGVGHVLAQGAVAIDTDTQGVGVQWSENATADSFAKNLIFARAELRTATSVYSPLGVVVADLTA